MTSAAAVNASKHRAPMPALNAANEPRFARIFLVSCLLSLAIALISVYFSTQNSLRKSCASVADGFTSIMQSYRHSFLLFEKLLQQEIAHTEDPDAIEAFLKEQDASLLNIEGGDYDGVYMYYQGRYLYSWGTPQSVYTSSGYDATKRPWYIGAVQARGDLFFSVPYPSYANDYMLSTISRLQPDGETVFAYDIKLGEIGRFVDKLDLYNGALTLICDNDGNIIGSTEHQYLGGNYTYGDEKLADVVLLAEQELSLATDENTLEKAELKIQNTKAQQRFCTDQREHLERLLSNERTLHIRLKDLSFGYALSNGSCNCFVVCPIGKLFPKLLLLWAALSFLSLVIAFVGTRFLNRANQVLTDALTGLNNRRAFHKYCNNHILHRPDEDLFLIMLDLDDFKQINDRFGHLTGDHALLDAAGALKRACAAAPCSFFLCRYGGDEFLLAGAGCTPDDILKTKALITENLALVNTAMPKPYTLSASIGTAGGRCTNMNSLERLLVLADEDMYQDKLSSKRRSSGESTPDDGDKGASHVL